MNLPVAGPRLWLRTAIAGAALLIPAVAAGAASAAAIAPTAACYVNAGSHHPIVGIIGSGFTPGDDIAISGNGFFAHTAASPTGTIALTGEGPGLGTIGPAVRTFTLQAQDESTGSAFLASTSIRVTNLAIGLSPSSVKNVHQDRVTYRFSGFRPGRHIYAYFRRKHSLAHYKFGKAAGPCGTAKAKALLYPGGHPGHNKYTVTFEQTSHYSKQSFPQIVSTLNLFF
ncbi:MAG: hypothetical protein ACR2NR_01545 [Solirubrobacteraceae bacterium]